jgi:parallel beta-helix repeat protein
MCLSFDGSGDYVALSSFTVSTNNGTIALWFRTSADFSANYGGQGNLISQNSQYYGYLAVAGNGTVPYGIYGETNSNNDYFVATAGVVPVGVWNHIAVSFYNKTAKTYLNGTLIQTLPVTSSSLTLARIGGGTSEFFNGKIDDVLFCNMALSAEEIWQLYQEKLVFKATNPNPANGAISVDPNIVISWSAGKGAASHDVYFGTDYNDVNNADTTSPEYKGNFDANTFDPCGLDFFKTYYWRIDEVNEPNLQKGYVWSFETGGPEIGLSATQFLFAALLGGANPNVQILGISNSGQDTLYWQISENCGWLSVEPNSGNSAGEIDGVNLSVDISGLAAGRYTCNLTVSDVNASNNPQTVGVTLYVITPEDALYVPSEYPTIQSAVDFAVDGDTVIVAPGTFTGPGNRDIDFLGKAITVRSIDPNDPSIVAATVVDHNGGPHDPYFPIIGEPNCVFYFHSGEDTNSIVEGFTIIRAYTSGIYCEQSSPKIKNCIVSENYCGIYCHDSNSVITGCKINDNDICGIYCSRSSPVITDCNITGTSGYYYSGGGIRCTGGSPTITDCIISNNDYSGIYCSGDNATITNCTITGNSAGEGGGINCHDSNATITGCTITGNSAGKGGGIFCFHISPKIINCNIIANSTNYGGGIYGYDSSPIITNCIIIGNSAGYEGGGIYCYDSSPVITGCTIIGNSAHYYGGGISDCHGIITNCIISGNSSFDIGGGLADCSGPITNCIISGNSANEGGGLACCYGPITNCTIANNSADYYGGGLCVCFGPITNCTIAGNYGGEGGGGLNGCEDITNCIIWGNWPDQILETWPITITYSDIQGGGWPGLGNIDTDPCFVDADANDYHLKSEGWSWDTKRSRWTYDDVTSRCIDAGNPGSPLGDELLSVPDDPNNEWGQNLRIDMGAFGGTAEASIPPYDWALLSDVTNDGISDFSDLEIFSSLWLNIGEHLYADFNRDGIIDLFDFALLAQDWLGQTTWH